MNPNDTTPAPRARDTLETDRASAGWARDATTAARPVLPRPMDLPAGMARVAGPMPASQAGAARPSGLRKPGEGEEADAEAAQQAASDTPPAAPSSSGSWNAVDAAVERPVIVASGPLMDRVGDTASGSWARDGGDATLDDDGPGLLGHWNNGYLAMLGAGGLVAGAVSSSAGSSAAVTPTAAPQLSHRVVVHDGLIAGATVYADSDGNGRLEESEKVGVTDARGELHLSGPLPAGNLVVTGGTNVDTGLPNTLTLVIAGDAVGDGTVVVNPLTTLVAEVYARSQSPGEDPLTLAQAETLVKAALGLPAGLSLGSYEAVPAAASGSADGLTVEKQAAQLATLLTSARMEDAGDGALSAVATWILDHPNEAAHLDQLATLQQIFPGLATTAAAELSDAATENQAIAAAASLDAVSQAQKASAAPVGLHLVNDTGSSGSDGLTIDPHVAATGMKVGATLQVSADGGANWVDAEAFAPASGKVTVIARQAYGNGFTSDATGPLTFTLDTRTPAAPTLALAQDTGTSADDAITSNANIVVGGRDEGAALEFSTDQVTWSTSQPTAQAGWNDVYARQVFTSTGAVSATTHLDFDLKTTAETGSAGLAANTDETTYDTGTAGDNITSFVQQDGGEPLRLQGTTEAGTTWIQVTVAGQVYTIAPEAIDSQGHWTLDLSAPLTEGTHDILVQARDVAGNLSEPTLAGTVVIDTTAPQGGTCGLSADGSGLIGDNLTNNTRPTIAGTAEPGAHVEVEVDGTVYTGSVDAQGHWSVVVNQALSDGEYTPSLTVIDAAGNAGEPIDGAPFTVLATPPQEIQPTSLIQDDASYDTGISANDGITSNPLPLIVGAVDHGNVAVVVRVGGLALSTVTDQDGAWQVQVPQGSELPDGTYIPHITYIDAAGNMVKVDGLPIVIDTTPPDGTGVTADLVHDAENDTGVSATDGITSNSSPTLVGTAEAFAHVAVDLGGNVYETDADAAGHWKLVADGLPDGEYTPSITETDLAGNVSDPIDVSTTFVVDTAEPDAPQGGLVHDDVNDTGVAIDDSITRNSRPAFTGTAAPGSLVTLEVGGVTFSGATDEQGNWTIKPDHDIPDGTWTPVASVMSLSGATASTEFDPITIATTPPDSHSVSGGLTPSADNDTGLSSADGITSNNAPELSGVAPAFSTLEIHLGDLVYTAEADDTGAWSVSLDTLPDGRYVPAMTVFDAAGNQSEPITGDAFVIDTALPGVPTGGLQHDAANDTGESATDNYTRNSQPELSGTADPLDVVQVDGFGDATLTTIADEQGHWSVRPAQPLQDGEYTPVVTLTTVAGVTGDSIELDPIVIATTMEPPTGGLMHDDVSDTGASTDDGITANNLPQLAGTAAPGAQVHISLADHTYTTVADENGAWVADVTEPLANGSYVPTITATDLAGNSATVAGELIVVSNQILLPGGPLGVNHEVQVGDALNIDPFPAGVIAGSSTVSDYSGSLAQGLTIDESTQHITGTPTAAGFTWISIEAADAAGNTATQYFQLAVTTQIKTLGGTTTSVYNAAPETASTYIGSDSAESANIYYSSGDVIEMHGGNDVVRLFRPEAMGFARLDGGAGDDQLIVYGTNISLDFSQWNNPDGNGQVMQSMESIFLSGTASDVTITADDVLHLQSDVLDVDGQHQLVRLQANSTNHGTVNISGMEQVGEVGQFGANGGASSGAFSDHYTKFVGTVSDSAGDHLVELLVQNGLTGTVS